MFLAQSLFPHSEIDILIFALMGADSRVAGLVHVVLINSLFSICQVWAKIESIQYNVNLLKTQYTYNSIQHANHARSTELK